MTDSHNTKWIWLFFTVLAVLSTDQASKFAVEQFSAQNSIQVLLPGLLNLVHTRNPGVAFGFLADADSPWVAALVLLFSGGVMVFLVWLLAAGRAGGRLGQIGMALILGGASGNLLDRLVHRSVTDFIDLHLRDHHWYTFNVADSAIVIGAGLVLLELLRDWRRPGREPKRENV
jgi:signal peptidase II